MIWTSKQLDNLEDEIRLLKDRKDSLAELKQQETVSSQRKMQQRIYRVQKSLIEENRLGKRKRGGGWGLSMDEVDERFLVECIDGKSTAHGRRHDSVMYLNHRVKKNNFLKIVNYSRHRRGLKPIKSAITVYNRARPKNIRSSQARRHLGLGLFCCKKPPKADDTANELVHYQRAHKKNILNDRCGIENQDNWKIFQISKDDRAYLCPGTGTNMNRARNQRIYQDNDNASARKLPKYDFPVLVVNVTPATHRVMTKETLNIDGKEEIKIVDDLALVFARSKHFVGSSGTVWASEFMTIQHEGPICWNLESPWNISLNTLEDSSTKSRTTLFFL